MSVRVACVIPALDAAPTLAGVVAGLRASVPDAAVVIVDDGSSDDTFGVARAMGDVARRHPRNRGKGAALRTGFAEALAIGADEVLTLDADGQHDPAAAPSLLEALARADLVIGTRARHGGMPLGRRVTNALASVAVGAIVRDVVPDSQSGFRAMHRAVVEQVRARGERYEFETDFLIRAVQAGFRLGAVPVRTVYGGRSHFRGMRDSVRVVRAIWRHRAGAIG